MNLCTYEGSDTTAVLTDTYDRDDPGAYKTRTYYSRCHCGKVTCESGTYKQAADALKDHREESSDGE
jgi:hypothetical protein